MNAVSLKENIIKMFNFYLYKMTQYNSLNVKLSNSWLNKLKSAIKNETEVVLTNKTFNKMKQVLGSQC